MMIGDNKMLKKNLFVFLFVFLFAAQAFAGNANVTLKCKNHGKKLLSLQVKLNLCSDIVGKHCPMFYVQEKKDILDSATFYFEDAEAGFDIKNISWSYSAVGETEATPEVSCEVFSDITYTCPYDNTPNEKHSDRGDVKLWVSGLCYENPTCYDLTPCKEAGNENCSKEATIKDIKAGEKGVYKITFKDIKVKPYKPFFVQVSMSCDKYCEDVFDFENTRPGNTALCQAIYETSKN